MSIHLLATRQGTKLKIVLDPESRAELQETHDEDPEGFDANSVMVDVFENLLCNSEYTWVDPSETGDLTSAPMLGILGPETTNVPRMAPRREVGQWDGQTHYQEIEQRWAFMDYQLRSPQRDLLEKGFCVFVG